MEGCLATVVYKTDFEMEIPDKITFGMYLHLHQILTCEHVRILIDW